MASRPSSREVSRDALTKHRASLPALTGIRFFAAFYVVLFHSLPWLTERYDVPRLMRIFLGNGYLAVALFFVLSGFILAYTYEGQVEGSVQRWRFWQARFARIYPVYFLSLASVYYFQRHLSSVTKILVLAMVQAWNPLQPALAGAWNYPAWSLSVEAFFYLLFPFVLPWFSRFSLPLLKKLLVILLAVCVFLRTPIQGLGDWSHSPGLLVIPLPLIRLPEFLAGVTLGNCLLRNGQPSDRRLVTMRAEIAASAALLVLCAPIGSWVSLVIVPFAVLVHDLAARKSALSRFLSSRSMLLLGGASYSIYLLQYPVRNWVRAFFSLLPASYAPASAPLTPIILIGVSILVYLHWEEPSRRMLRRWFSRPESSSQPSIER